MLQIMDEPGPKKPTNYPTTDPPTDPTDLPKAPPTKSKPRTVIQRWADQGTQYQLFPEEYFAGSDVNIYFGDTWIDDCTGLSFTLQEKVLPIYGYGSYTPDIFARGTRLVQGQFSIAFREVGYLYTVLDNIAADSYLRPPIAEALQMDGKTESVFVGKAKRRIEDMLQGYVQAQNRPDAYDPDHLGDYNWPVLKMGMGKETFEPDPEKGTASDQIAQQIQSVRQLLLKKGYLASSSTSGYYDADLTRAVATFQRNLGIVPITGQVDKETRIALYYSIEAPEKTRFVTWKQQQRDELIGAKTNWAKLEAEIWGRGQQVEGTEVRSGDAKKYQPYFYGNPNHQDLLARSFDLFITYGPIAEEIEEMGRASDRIGFNTTVKAIRNVQLTGVQQVISPATGEPIAEVYSFLAEDLD